MKRILVVDDEPDVLKVVIFRLKKAGFEIVNATNGQEALDIIKSGKIFDLIVLDLIMPVMNGYEFCKIIKEGDETKNIPVIILSASATRDIKEKIKELKAEGYITKPFETDVLLEKIHSFIG